MTMPGFSAEKSHYKTVNHYQTGTCFTQTPGRVQAAAIPPTLLAPVAINPLVVIGGGVVLIGGEIFLIWYWNREPAPPPSRCTDRNKLFHCAYCDPGCHHNALEYCFDHGCAHTFKTNPDGSCDVVCV